MGVVRREGDWRLEKHADGVYEVTHDKRLEVKILTPEYSPTGYTDERLDVVVPVREVDSFSEAEAVFSNVSQGRSTSGGLSTSGQLDETGALSELPPGGALLVGYLGGGYLLLQSAFVVDSLLFILGVGFVGIGLVVTALAYRVYASDGFGAAVSYLVTQEESESHTEQADESATIPPAPKRLKNKLYFERANQQCEWCDEVIDSPDVHHIEPRREGGPNEPSNLIVLCPNCHRKADRGSISRSKLRYKVDSQMDA